MSRSILLIAIVAVVAVISVSISLNGVLSAKTGPGSEQVHEQVQGEAVTHLPVNVREVFPERDRGYDALGQNFVRIDEGFVDDTTFCNFCLAIEYKPGANGKADVAFKSREPIDLSNATVLRFAIRSDNAGDELRVLGAGIHSSEETGSNDTGIRRTSFQFDKKITVTADWTLYEVPLSGFDLEEITHGFALEMSSADMSTREVIYLDAISYDNGHSEYAKVI